MAIFLLVMVTKDALSTKTKKFSVIKSILLNSLGNHNLKNVTTLLHVHAGITCSVCQSFICNVVCGCLKSRMS